MTNEEAIAIIQNEYKCVDRDCDIERSCGKCNLMMPSKEPILEAYKLASKALSQVSEIEENIIKYMKKYPNHVGNTDFWEGFYACRNAVLQLDDEEYAPKEQQPCDDAVNRADFEAHLFENYCVPVSKIGKPNQYSSGCFYKDVVKCLDELPSVTQKSDEHEQLYKNGFADGYEQGHKDAEQKTGHWIAHSDGIWIEYYECSECGKVHGTHSDYCPNCGAKMVEPQESEEV